MCFVFELEEDGTGWLNWGGLRYESCDLLYNTWFSSTVVVLNTLATGSGPLFLWYGESTISFLSLVLLKICFSWWSCITGPESCWHAMSSQLANECFESIDISEVNLAASASGAYVGNDLLSWLWLFWGRLAPLKFSGRLIRCLRSVGWTLAFSTRESYGVDFRMPLVLDKAWFQKEKNQANGFETMYLYKQNNWIGFKCIRSQENELFISKMINHMTATVNSSLQIRLQIRSIFNNLAKNLEIVVNTKKKTVVNDFLVIAVSGLGLTKVKKWKLRKILIEEKIW